MAWLGDEQAYLPVLCIRWHMRGRKASLFIDHLADTVWSKGGGHLILSFWMAHAIAPAWKVQCLAICGTSASAPTPTQLTHRPEGNQRKHASVGRWGIVFGGDITLHQNCSFRFWMELHSLKQLGWIRCKMDHNATGVNTMIDQLAEVPNETNQSLGRKRWHTDLKKYWQSPKNRVNTPPTLREKDLSPHRASSHVAYVFQFNLRNFWERV